MNSIMGVHIWSIKNISNMCHHMSPWKRRGVLSAIEIVDFGSKVLDGFHCHISKLKLKIPMPVFVTIILFMMCLIHNLSKYDWAKIYIEDDIIVSFGFMLKKIIISA